MKFHIRKYHPSDLYSLYRICLLTGDSGKDASSLFKDPELLGHFYAAPYAIFEPGLCFILTKDNIVGGYILGASNSLRYSEWCEKEWFPVLREKYSKKTTADSYLDSRIISLINDGYHPKPGLLDYPAHLHIDLLPECQGSGNGRKMIERFINKLKYLNVPALHLEVGKRNEGAIKFYEKSGFHIIEEYEFSIAFGMKLN